MIVLKQGERYAGRPDLQEGGQRLSYIIQLEEEVLRSIAGQGEELRQLEEVNNDRR